MSVLQEVLGELWSMFVGDRRLTVLLLGVVVATAAAAKLLRPYTYWADILLLVGALAVLADSVVHFARRSRP